MARGCGSARARGTHREGREEEAGGQQEGWQPCKAPASLRADNCRHLYRRWWALVRVLVIAEGSRARRVPNPALVGLHASNPMNNYRALDHAGLMNMLRYPTCFASCPASTTCPATTTRSFDFGLAIGCYERLPPGYECTHTELSTALVLRHCPDLSPVHAQGGPGRLWAVQVGCENCWPALPGAGLTGCA